MRIDMREARIAFSHFFYALVATTILIALFSALIFGRANKPIDCSWQNQSGRFTSQATECRLALCRQQLYRHTPVGHADRWARFADAGTRIAKAGIQITTARIAISAIRKKVNQQAMSVTDLAYEGTCRLLNEHLRMVFVGRGSRAFLTAIDRAPELPDRDRSMTVTNVVAVLPA